MNRYVFLHCKFVPKVYAIYSVYKMMPEKRTQVYVRTDVPGISSFEAISHVHSVLFHSIAKQ